MELFPRLPNELGRQCLLRVSYESHRNLAAVCRSWEATVNSPEFYHDRKTLGTSQQVICFLELRKHPDNHLEFVVTVFDPLQHTWETLPPLPQFPGYHHHGIPLYCNCISVNQKLVLMGGFTLSDDNGFNTVFIYDFSSAKWSRGADMPRARIFHALSVSPEGLIYVAGEAHNVENDLQGAEVYSVEEDEWTLLPEMSQEGYASYAVFNDGKFYVIDFLEQSAEVYDPKREAWTTIPKEEIPPKFHCLIASSDGARIFSIDDGQDGLGVIEYDSEENVWRVVCSLPETFQDLRSRGAWRDRIFASGYAKGTLGTLGEVLYMLKPPPIGNEAGAQADNFGKWEAIERPQHSHVDYVQSIERAVTIEI